MDKTLEKKQFQALLKDGLSIMVGGFMTCGTPETLIDWVVESGVKDLTIICNDAGFPEQGVGKLIKNHQVNTLIASHIGLNPFAGAQMSSGELNVILIPQGTLAEQIRAHGAGLGGILTPTGRKTIVEEGKQLMAVNGVEYLLEPALGADLALIEIAKCDPLGNAVYAKTARNFNPVMATACETVVALTHKMVPAIDPEVIVTPHVFIDYIVKEHDHA